MKKVLFVATILALTSLYLTRCANPRSPMGGPQDTIPPQLIQSFPSIGSINFNDQEITLVFDEYINADKLTQSLIISPKSDIKFKHIVKKNELLIKFDEPLKDSTTYSFNFFNGITDITEKSPAVNLVLAFSTGSYIDSLSVTGKTEDLFTQEPIEKAVVGLYEITDSLDLLTDFPTYFTTTDKEGFFSLSYLKPGKYKLLTFIDDNNNITLNPEEEKHGFLSDTIILSDTLTDLETIPLLQQDIRPLKLNGAKNKGKYFDLSYNKTVDRYTVIPENLSSVLQGEDKDRLRFYKPEHLNFNDTLLVIIKAEDKFQSTAEDTIKLYFIKDERKKDKFSTTLPTEQFTLRDTISYKISFNKPVSDVNTDSIFYSINDTISFPSDSISFEWNHNKTQLKMAMTLDSKAIIDQIELLKADTIAQDTAVADTVIQLLKKQYKVFLKMHRSSFVSVEKDTLSSQKIIHKIAVKKGNTDEKYVPGQIKLKIITEHPSFKIQLYEKQQRILHERKNELNPLFEVLPGTYRVRVYIDSNNDSTWYSGNLLLNEEPERVYNHPGEIPVKENWIIEDVEISF